MDEQKENCHEVLIYQQRYHLLLTGDCKCGMLGKIILTNWRAEVEMEAALQEGGKREIAHATFFENGVCKNGQ